MNRILPYFFITILPLFHAFPQNVASNSATGLNYTTVQAAIDASASGYTVYLTAHTYSNIIVSGKFDLTIMKSPGFSGTPRILGNNTLSNRCGISIENSVNVTVSNVLISGWSTGITVSNAPGVRILECEITNNSYMPYMSSPIGIGIYAINATNFIMRRSVLKEHPTAALIFTRCRLGNSVVSNLIGSAGMGYGGYGIIAEASSDITMLSNVFISNSMASIALSNATNMRVHNNDFYPMWSPPLSSFFNGMQTTNINNIVTANRFYGRSNSPACMLSGHLNSIDGNLVQYFSSGIELTGNSNSIIYNTIQGCSSSGVYLNGHSNSIVSNTILSNGSGVQFSCSFPANTNVLQWNNLYDNSVNIGGNGSTVIARSNYYGIRRPVLKRISISASPLSIDPWRNSYLNTAGDMTPPSIPTGVTAATNTADSAIVVVNWNTIADADFSNYTVFRTLASSYSNIGDESAVATTYTIGQTTITDRPPQDAAYQYYITACDTNGNESWYSSAATVVFSGGGYVITNTTINTRYKTLESALSAAGNNHTLLLLTNIYATNAFLTSLTGVTISHASLPYTPFIIGMYTGNGITLSNCTASTITGIGISNFNIGIFLHNNGYGNNTILSNLFYNNMNGMRISSSSNRIAGNTFASNRGNGLSLECTSGIFPSRSNDIAGNSITANISNGIAFDWNVLNFSNSIRGNSIERSGQSGIYNSVSNTITSNTTRSNATGIHLLYGNRVFSNYAFDNTDGIQCYWSSYPGSNQIVGNMIMANRNYGVALNSSSNTVHGNWLLSNSIAVSAQSVSANIISGNSMASNYTGVSGFGGRDNVITSNRMALTAMGIQYSSGLSNIIEYNDISAYSYTYSDYGPSTNILRLNNLRYSNAGGPYYYYGSISIMPNALCQAMSNYYGTRTYSLMGSVGGAQQVTPWRTGPINLSNDIDAPPAIATISAATNASGVLLSWSPVGSSDLSNYRVFRSLSASFSNIVDTEFVGTAGSATFIDTPPLNGNFYYYVTAVDTNGNEGWYSPVTNVGYFPFTVASNSATGLTYASVQAAIDAASSNYSVYLLSNTTEQLSFVGKTNVSLLKYPGLPFTPRIIGYPNGTGIMVRNARGVSLSEFRVESCGIGIAITNSDSISCTYLSIASNSNSGMSIAGVSNIHIASNYFFSNSYSFSSPYAAINMFDGTTAVSILSNRFLSNAFGIVCYSMSFPVYSNTITGNDMLGNACGIALAGNTVFNNIATNMVRGGIYPGYLYNCRSNTIACNTLTEGAAGLLQVMSVGNIIGFNNIMSNTTNVAQAYGYADDILQNNFFGAREWTNMAVSPAGGSVLPWRFSMIDFTADIVPPTVPLGISALPFNGTNFVSWNPIADGDLACYRVYRVTNDDISNISTSQCIGILPAGTTNYPDISPQSAFYYVTAIDTASNESWYSASAFAPASNLAPWLFGEAVTPVRALSNSLFTFRVTFRDIDGDAPTYVRIVISNLGPFPITNDMAYDSGVLSSGARYTNATNLGIPTNCSFFCIAKTADTNEVKSALMTGPQITSAGYMSNFIISPMTNYSTNTFGFNALYRDLDGDAPASGMPLLVLSNERISTVITQSMNFLSGTYAAGAVYAVTNNGLVWGTYRAYAVTASTDAMSATNWCMTNIMVSNSVPTLTNADVTPDTGGTGTAFTFSVHYRDYDDDGPSNGVYLVLSNAGAGWVTNTMVKGPGTFTGGVTYSLTTNGITAGTNRFFVYAIGSNSTFTNITTNDLHPIVYNNTPGDWSNVTVTPTNGSILDTFAFSVLYFDPENDAPTNVSIVLKNTNSNTVSTNAMTSSGGTYSNGVIYTFSTNALAPGGYAYWAFVVSTNSLAVTNVCNGYGIAQSNLVVIIDSPPTLTLFSTVPKPASGYIEYRYTITDAESDLMHGIYEYREAGTSIWTEIPTADMSNASAGVTNGTYCAYWYPKGIDTAKQYDLRMRIRANTLYSTYAYDNGKDLSAMFGVKTDLAKAAVIGNPFRGGEGVTFVNLTTDTVVTVFTIAGQFVAEVRVDPNTPDGALGRVLWRVKNKDGRDVAPGVYICSARSASIQKTKVLKVVVVR